MLAWQLVVLFLLISFVYASVGFGGGSSYIALLALWHMPVYEMKLIALSCNIIVVAGGTWLFVDNRQLDWRNTLPLVAASIPLAYAGALIRLSNEVFFVILGCSLLVAGILLMVNSGTKKQMFLVGMPFFQAVIGGGIGLLSGLVGIGGGIFLSPLLHLARWNDAKKIAATASFFILVNSVSGLIAHYTKQHDPVGYAQFFAFAIAVFLGGQLGSRVGLKLFPEVMVRRVTGILVLFAAFEILKNHVHYS